MVRGNKGPTEGQGDLFDELMAIEDEPRPLTPSADALPDTSPAQPDPEPRRPPAARPAEPTDLFGLLDAPTPESEPPAVSAEPAARDIPMPATPVAGEPFRLDAADQYAPSGAKARFHANVAAIETVRQLEAEARPATRAEQEVLAAWSSWGAVADVFDERKENWSTERDQLRQLLSEDEFAQARRTILNAHFTSPALVAAMWEGMEQLGFTEGRVLEPGAGSGNFIGTAPAGAQMVGVELDPLSASIASHLYPQADVRAESFAHTRVNPGAFDAAIGNVPFGDVRLTDATWNPQNRFSIHNHFIRKAVGGLHPGGVMAVMTSAYSMDNRNPAFRAEVSREADLLGAIRLPNGTHRRTAGTEALTDVLFFRKRMEGEEPTPATRAWVKASPLDIDVNGVTRTLLANDYFQQHPENVLGEWGVSGQWGNLAVTTGDLTAVPALFADRVRDIAADARAAGRGYVPLDAAARQERDSAQERETILAPGTIVVDGPGFQEVDLERSLEPLDVPASAAAELRSLVELRDALHQVVRDQATTVADTDESAQLREDARAMWAAHVDRFGPVNRFDTRWSTRTQENPETGEKEKVRVPRRAYPRATMLMKSDPLWSVVSAAESFDEDSQTATPADILTHRTVTVERPLLGADTAEEALALAIDATGRADLSAIAARLGADPETTRAELGTLVFDDPTTGDIVTRPEYLSGDVRTKLEEAQAAHEADPAAGWQTNITALEAVIPEDVPMSEIEALPGAVFIPVSDHEQFFAEVVGDEEVSVLHPGPGFWDVRPGAGARQTVQATSEWGTQRRPAHDLFRSLLRGTEIRVEDDAPGESRGKVLNPLETEAAREKAEALAERFTEWVWEDPERATRLHRAYNRQFNSLVARDYTEEGQRLTLPGLSAEFDPHPHQRTAVARIVSEPAVGLFHQVGAGKTAAMVMGMMELKRRGLVNKPVVAVPGHMLEQFTREWQQLYPTARLLSAGSDDVKVQRGDTSARRAFIAKAAMNDWDGIVMTHSAFERIAVSDQTLTRFTAKRVNSLRETLDNLNNDPAADSTRTSKQIEKAIAREEEQLAKALDGRDVDGLTIEAMGIDYVAVDEAHLFKNLRTFSNIPGAGIEGSGRALDMEMKLDYLRTTFGERVVTMATGTPVANSITETHVMMRYLRPDLLEKAGVEHFDDWGNTFGELVTRFERDAAGRLKQTTRFSKFKNVPEMLATWQQFADVKMSEDLDLKIPLIQPDHAGERRARMEVIPRSEALTEYMGYLEQRLDALKGRAKPGEDNHLSVYGDGRKAALDPRLVGLETGETVKINTVAHRIAEIWRDVRDNEYPRHADTSEISPQRGGLQIVFCDLSTPNPGRWNFYQQLRVDLVEKYGMDRDRIRFVHEARNDEEKADLFRQAREGGIDVLIGSSERMGTGANIQLRAVALHHADCPWRPAELTQREGRILRQGNANDEVSIIKYATENSFDSTAWDIIARKAAPIHQLMKGRIDVRELDDPGDMALDAQTLMAASSGNPLLLNKVELETEVTKLERRSRAHDRQEMVLRSRHTQATHELAHTRDAVPELDALIDRSVPTKGDQFVATINGRQYDSRQDATQAIVSDMIGQVGSRGVYYVPETTHENAVTLGGHSFSYSMQARPARNATVRFSMDDSDLNGTWLDLTWSELISGNPPNVALLLENRVTALPDLKEKMIERQSTATSEIAGLEAQWNKPFKHAERLTEARAELDDVNRRLGIGGTAESASNERAPEPPDRPAGIADEMRTAPRSTPLSGGRSGARMTIDERPSPHYGAGVSPRRDGYER